MDHGLLVDPIRREVKNPFTGDPVTLPVYSTGRACEALGKARMTVLKWQKDNIIPLPRLHDSMRPYRYYSEGELNLIGSIIAKWEKQYKYLTTKNTELIDEMRVKVEQYREEKV